MKAKSRRGMTLLELMMAMGLFAVIITAAFPMVDQAMGRFQMARDHYVAATICQARIERARGVPHSDLTLLAETGAVVDDFGNAATDGRFRRTTTLTPDSPLAGMTRMTVKTDICCCTRWGWRKHLHPLREGPLVCRFGDEGESMSFLFTYYER